MVIKRTLSEKIKQLAGKFPVISINGPRQSGKTTLAKLCFPGYDYVNLEMPDNRTFAREDPRSFLKSYSQGVIIDEIQYVPELFSISRELLIVILPPGSLSLQGRKIFC
jgi:uncharacterized protein